MNNFHRDFPGRRHVVLPVIHLLDRPALLANAKIAVDAGADGVFVIYGGECDFDELGAVEVLRAKFPRLWVGINRLGRDRGAEFLGISSAVKGVWTDYGGVTDDGEKDAEESRAIRLANGWSDIVLFGGVAFKHQRPVQRLAETALRATRYMEVVCTSGPATAQAADVAKIRAMKEGMQGWPLAIASGITPANVADYLPFADAFLVASGISKDWHHFDAGKVGDLVRRVHSYQEAPS